MYRLIAVITLAPCACDPSGTGAVPAPVVDLDTLAASADAVFVGKVERVESRVSEAAPGSTPIPFTFVTFAVEESDDLADTTVTLRFIGGTWPDGRRLVVSHQPKLGVGETWLVHARDNGEAACPVVGCQDGLFRLDGGQVRGRDHRRVWRGADDNLRLGVGEEAPEAGARPVEPRELVDAARLAARTMAPAGRSLARVHADAPFQFAYDMGSVPVDAR